MGIVTQLKLLTLQTEELFMSINLDGFADDGIAYCEAMGLSKVFAAYAANASRENIEAIGFNHNSGYVYIALENGIEICSCLGHNVEYLVTRWEDGIEHFFDSYEEALSSDLMDDEEEDFMDDEEEDLSIS